MFIIYNLFLKIKKHIKIISVLKRLYHHFYLKIKIVNFHLF